MDDWDVLVPQEEAWPWEANRSGFESGLSFTSR